jgi:hypothetical protein
MHHPILTSLSRLALVRNQLTTARRNMYGDRNDYSLPGCDVNQGERYSKVIRQLIDQSIYPWHHVVEKLDMTVFG